MAVKSHVVTVASVVHVVYVTVNAAAGTWTLAVNGGTPTAPLDFDIDAASDLQDAVDALPGIPAGSITVAGGPGDDTGSAPYTFTMADSRNVLTTDDALLTGGTHTAAVSIHTQGAGPFRIDTTSETDARDGSTILLRNNGAKTVYLGGPDVTTTNGFPVAATTTLLEDLDVTDAEQLWACTTAGDTTTVAVLETGI